jgi:hypothetical protein
MPIRPRTAALGAGACLALMAVVWFAAFHIGFLERADESIFVQFGGLHGPLSTSTTTPSGWRR